MNEISRMILSIVESPSIPTSSWMRAIYVRAETLAYMDRIDEALKMLKKICFILPPMPLNSLNYIEKTETLEKKILER